jgi:hypothetical protein
MKVSGFTFVRNAVRFGFPVEAAIRSILPLVDEMVVNVGVSEDGTRQMIEAIGDPRLLILDSVWDETLLERGRLFAEQTDIALARCTGDVCLYVQADELVHEDDHAALRRSLRQLHEEEDLEGLIFDWLHFYGSYHTVGISRSWYRREVRAFRNRIGVRSWKDAQGFRIWDPPPGWHASIPRTLKDGDPARKLRVGPSGARIFHYGWVRPPELQRVKLAEQVRFHYGEPARAEQLRRGFAYDLSEKVRLFTGTHPAPIREAVARADWPFEPKRRWVRRGHVRVDLLDLFEAATGVRIGEYRNYELVR